MDNDSFLPESSALRTLSADIGIAAGAGRALLLQIAHPRVARGVAHHSDYSRSPLSRLIRTLGAAAVGTFGTTETAEAVAARIRSSHEKVRGASYSAFAPELIEYVQGTLIDSAVVAWKALYGDRLDDSFLDSVYGDSQEMMRMIGHPGTGWHDGYASFANGLAATYESLTVSDDGKAIFQELRNYTMSPGRAIFGVPFWYITTGLLPESVRQQFGLRWTNADAQALRVGLRAIGLVLESAPSALRRVHISLLAAGPVRELLLRDRED